MDKIPEQYRMPAIAAAILVIAIGVAVATKNDAPTLPTPPAEEQDQVTPGVVVQTPTTTAAPIVPKTTTTPTKKPTTKTTPTTPQTVTNPTMIGKAPTIVSNELKLTAVLSKYGADLAWTPSYQKDLKGIIVVKSTTDPNPYYPKQAWSLFRPAGTGNDSWTDRNIEAGKTTYYRVCGFHTDDSVFCGNVVSVKKP